MNKALILTGSNMHPVSQNLGKAAEMLEDADIKIIRRSAVYKSPPWGYESSNDFLNQVLMLETKLSPFELMKKLLMTETRMGRTRSNTERYSDRIIDIDLLLYNKEVIHTRDLIVPHPRMHLRKFALLPSAEIAGKWIHPVFRISLEELLLRCPDTSEVSIAMPAEHH